MHPVRSLLAVSVMVLGVAGGAAAQTTPALDIQIERDTRPRTSVLSDLSAAYRVTLRDRTTGRTPQESYVVFAQATNHQGEKSHYFACGHVNDVDSRTPPGVYDCIVYVDHGGPWEFVAVVSKERSDARQAPVPVAQASVPFELVTGDTAVGDDETDVNANSVEVAVLLGHSAVAMAWFACVALLASLALPGGRGWLSTLGCHRLERRLELIVKATLVTTGLVFGSGTYLTLSQTAYDAPFSSAAVDAVFALPYGKPYFLALSAKIALYVLMVAASVPLVRGARRRMLSSVDAPEFAAGALDHVPSDEERQWADPAGLVARSARDRGALAVAEPEVARVQRTAVPPVERHGPGTVRLGALVVLAGGVGVWVCVTLLKYLHELIESARALL